MLDAPWGTSAAAYRLHYTSAVHLGCIKAEFLCVFLLLQ